MSIAPTVEAGLNRAGVSYELIPHRPTANSTHTARAAHIPGDRLAKCVMLQDDVGYLMAVVPATTRVDLGALHSWLHRDLGLSTERELAPLFRDCEPGAIPPLANLYGIVTILDDRLLDGQDVYFESGDHCALVHVSGRDFVKLMGNARCGT